MENVMKQQVDAIATLWIKHLATWQVDKVTSWWDSKLTNEQVYKTEKQIVDETESW
jgi:hypothetical protein